MMDSYIHKEVILQWINEASQDETGRARKSILKDNLKDEMFIKTTDFTDEKRCILLKTSELDERSQFWQYWQKTHPAAIVIGQNVTKINVPYLYEQTLKDFQLRKDFRKNSQIGSVDEFHNTQTKYIKCLQKRKDDLIGKISKSSFAEIPFVENSTHNQTKQIDLVHLQEYKNKHYFNWDRIDATSLTNKKWKNDKQFHKISMKSLENECFIVPEDEMEKIHVLGIIWLPTNASYECFIVPEDEMEKIHVPGIIWLPDVVNGELNGELVTFRQEILVTDAYILSRIDNEKFKEWVSQIPNNPDEIESILKTFCKKLSKRKSDFLNACIKNGIVSEMEEDPIQTDSPMEQ